MYLGDLTSRIAELGNDELLFLILNLEDGCSSLSWWNQHQIFCFRDAGYHLITHDNMCLTIAPTVWIENFKEIEEKERDVIENGKKQHFEKRKQATTFAKKPRENTKWCPALVCVCTR